MNLTIAFLGALLLVSFSSGTSQIHEVRNARIRSLLTSKTLSDGAQLTVNIQTPLDGTKVPLDETCSASAIISGTAEIGKGVGDVTYIFIIDDSGSTSSILAGIKTFFKGLTEVVFAEGSAKNAGVVRFDDTASITQGLTNDISLIKAGIDAATTSGATNCIDGLVKAQQLAQSADAGGTTIILFAGDGVCNTPESNFDPSSAAASLAALTNTNVFIDTIAIGTPCAGGLQSIPRNGGSCKSVSKVSDYNIKSVIGTTLKAVELKVTGGDWTPIPTNPSGDQPGPSTKQFDSSATINPGDNSVCVRATGDDVLPNEGNVAVTECIHIFGIDTTAPNLECSVDLTVDTAPGTCVANLNPIPKPSVNDNCDTNLTPTTTVTNPFVLGTTTVQWTVSDAGGNQDTCSYKVTVEDNEAPDLKCPADVTVDTAPGTCVANLNPIPIPTVTDNCDSNLTPTTSATNPFVLGTTSVQWTVSDAGGNQDTCSYQVNVEDNEAPKATCSPGVNPAGKTPPANNQDGFFILGGGDNCAVASIYVVDMGSGHRFGPYPAGTNFKYVQAPGAPVREKPGSGAVIWMLTGNGDAQVVVTDTSGNVQTANCRVPPPPAHRGRRHLRDA